VSLTAEHRDLLVATAGTAMNRGPLALSEAIYAALATIYEQDNEIARLKADRAFYVADRDRLAMENAKLTPGTCEGCLLQFSAAGDDVTSALAVELTESKAEVVRLAGIVGPLQADRDRLAAIVEPKWQPMNTAPRDGTEVILCVTQRAGSPWKCLVGHYMPGGHCIEDHPPINEGWYFWNGCFFSASTKPVAWMPLPEITEAAKEKA
jgi:hypothetical protein